MVQGVPGSLRPRIILTFGITRVVGHQPYAPAAFTQGEIPGTHFQRLSRPQSTWFCREKRRKKSSVTPPGIDPGSSRLVAHCLNHYATPGPGGGGGGGITFYCTCIEKYTGKIICIHSLLFSPNFMLPSYPRHIQS